ncbi:MAG TPA: hypothetical protein VMY42_18280 [Thermoguttaceae bacterium]|nr:hypothetical protein [Thermoguttaceae bacterium]
MADTIVTSTALQYLFEEELYPTVQDTLPEICPIADKLTPTFRNVERQSGIGRKWTIRHIFSAGMAGHMKWVDDRADNLRRLENVQKHSLTAQLPTNTWTSATEISMATAYERDVPMAAAMGNIPMPLEVVQSSKLDSAMIDLVARNLKGAAKMVALSMINSWFKAADGSLGTVSTVNASYTGATGVGDGEVRITALATGRIRKFMDGQMVDVFSSDWATQRNKVSTTVRPLVVDGSDPLSGQLRLVCPFGVIDSGVAIGDIIIPYGSKMSGQSEAWSGPYGFADFIKQTGTILGRTGDASFGIDVDVRPVFKSYVKAHSAALTEMDLNKYIGFFQEATGIGLDTIITTLGVANKLQEQPFTGSSVYRQAFDRTGQALEYVAGRAAIRYVYEGKEFDWFICSLSNAGEVLILRRNGQNYKQYTPPPIESTADAPPNFGNAIEFVGRALGFTGMWIPVLSNSEFYPMVQAPFLFRTQLLPENPQSIKLTGCTESNV